MKPFFYFICLTLAGSLTSATWHFFCSDYFWVYSINGVNYGIFHIKYGKFTAVLRFCNKIFQTLCRTYFRQLCPFWISYSIFLLQKLYIRILFKGVSSLNCPKFIKIWSFLVIPHSCPAFLKYALLWNFKNLLKLVCHLFFFCKVLLTNILIKKKKKHWTLFSWVWPCRSSKMFSLKLEFKFLVKSL